MLKFARFVKILRPLSVCHGKGSIKVLKYTWNICTYKDLYINPGTHSYIAKFRFNYPTKSFPCWEWKPEHIPLKLIIWFFAYDFYWVGFVNKRLKNWKTYEKVLDFAFVALFIFNSVYLIFSKMVGKGRYVVPLAIVRVCRTWGFKIQLPTRNYQWMW